jgi:hypothetical protein
LMTGGDGIWRWTLTRGYRWHWLARAVQGSSRNSLRIKVRETTEGHAVLLLVCINMEWGGRSGGLCQTVAFGTPVWFEQLTQ